MTRDLDDAQEGIADSFRELTRTFSGNVDNPYPLMRERRKNAPVHEGDILAEFRVPSRASAAAIDGRKVFTVYRYDDLSRILRDAKTFTSGFLSGRPGFLGAGITSLDGEEHRYQRNLFSQAFANRQALEKWQADVINAAVQRDILGPIADRGGAELIGDIALKFPVRIIYQVIGFPDSQEQADYFAAQALWALTSIQSDPEKTKLALARAERAAGELYDYTLAAVKERRRRNAGENCLIDCLLAARDENGASLDDDQIAQFTRSLLPAAAETTTRSFANLIVLLFDNPDQLARVRADRSLVPRAVTEAVRLEGPAAFLAREAGADVELSGVTVPAGSILSLALGSGNHDDEAFPDGDAFDIGRKMKPSLGFGFGPHMCLGMQIAKLEMEAVLNGLLDLPDFRLDPAAPRPEIKGLHFRCSDAVPVLWN